MILGLGRLRPDKQKLGTLMLFVSPIFLQVFLPLTLAAYYFTLFLIPSLSVQLILIASLIFYAFGGAEQMAVLLASVLVNYFLGHFLAQDKIKSDRMRLNLLFVGVAFNTLLLAYFKYSGFLLENLNAVFSLKLTFSPPLFPIGISFYTFTQIAFLVDSYRRKGPRKLILSHYLLFVTYFPHLIAGPIIHWREMMPQFSRISRARLRSIRLNEEVFYRGAALFAMGLFKKVFIADRLASFVEAGYAHAAGISFLDAWQTSLCYSFQLYFDFSGYSDMAIGMSYLLGVALPVNFDSPYKSRSVREFWRRWHMTLSRWLRDYIYIPLGGGRGSQVETLRNLFLTFLVGGLWHGASWTFVIWGALHGAACCAEHIFSSRRIAINPVVATVMTFIFVNFAWVFFRAPDLATALTVVKSMISPGLGESKISSAAVSYLLVSGIICWGLPTSQFVAMQTRIVGNPLVAALIGVVLFLAILCQNSSVPSPFLYFNF